jgi:hypothetical protein
MQNWNFRAILRDGRRLEDLRYISGMAFRLDKCVVRGWLDNTTKGKTRGEIWLLNQEHPVQLDLRGNCLRDLAGCRIEFENNTPEDESHCRNLNHVQAGAIGDVTAARKVKVLTEPVDEVVRRRRENPQGGPPPTRVANCLYLEWFSRRNGRVLIESVDFNVRIVSGPKWRMSEEEEREQLSANVRAMEQFFEQLPEDDDETPTITSSMNEFEWEIHLRHSDERGQKYAELLEKYQDHPDSERIIAREMGWSHLEDLLDAEARGLFRHVEEEPIEYDPPEPNPLTEGKDWILNTSSRPVHPLQNRASELAMEIHQLISAQSTDADPAAELVALRGETQALAAKLSGALNGLAYDRVPEPGFVVASLKRALAFLNQAFSALHKVEQQKLLTPDACSRISAELFAIREEMLRLMDHFRNYPGF